MTSNGNSPAALPLRRDRYFLTLLVLLAAFVGWRAQYLDIPFYWDEAWVYAPAVKAMEANGVSILPDAIAPSLSRGHPLLFHALAGLWATIFGTTALSLHAFALTIAALLVLAVFIVGRTVASSEVALGAAAFVLTHEGFLAQSGLLLPELLLALFSVLALHQFLLRKTLGYAVFSSCALLTKEAALPLIIAFTAWQVVQCSFGKKEEHVMQLKWLFIAVAPVLLAGVYFFIQYRMFGWVFFPEHLELMTWDLKDITYKARLIFSSLFEEQGRIVFTYASTLMATLLWNRGKVILRVVSALLFIAAIKALWGRWPVPMVPEPISTLLVLAVLFFTLFIPYQRKEDGWSELLPLVFLTTVATWGFCALNFYTDRYLMMLAPFLAIGGASFMAKTFSIYPRWVSPAIMLMCILAQASQIGADDRISDTRLSYLDAIAAEKEMIVYCEQQDLYGSSILVDFVHMTYMQDVNAGYLSSDRGFSHVTMDTTRSSDYAIVRNTPHKEGANAEYRTVHRISIGKAWVELRKRIGTDRSV